MQKDMTDTNHTNGDAILINQNAASATSSNPIVHYNDGANSSASSSSSESSPGLNSGNDYRNDERNDDDDNDYKNYNANDGDDSNDASGGNYGNDANGGGISDGISDINSSVTHYVISDANGVPQNYGQSANLYPDPASGQLFKYGLTIFNNCSATVSEELNSAVVIPPVNLPPLDVLLKKLNVHVLNEIGVLISEEQSKDEQFVRTKVNHFITEEFIMKGKKIKEARMKYYSSFLARNDVKCDLKKYFSLSDHYGYALRKIKDECDRTIRFVKRRQKELMSEMDF